jgi:hypothetical protein
MHHLSPADELATLRARMAHLRRREQELRRALLDGPEAALTGDHARVEVSLRRIRIFDHRLLPEAIRDEPLYWRERDVTDLRCVPLRGADSSGWLAVAPGAVLMPARRAAGH